MWQEDLLYEDLVHHYMPSIGSNCLIPTQLLHKRHNEERKFEDCAYWPHGEGRPH